VNYDVEIYQINIWYVQDSSCENFTGFYFRARLFDISHFA